MSSPAPTPPRAVTVLITRHVPPSQAAAFEATMAGMLEAAARFPGHLGGQVVRPGDPGSGDDPMLYHVVFAFDDEAHLAAWESSPERAHWLAQVQAHTVGEQRDRVSGVEYWFQPPGGAPQAPPRWRVAVVTWLGIFPTVLFLFLTVAPWLEHWPLVPRVFVITVLVVVIMTWLVAPRLTRWLAHWLHAGR
jgi:antibiotic biosynthesis monooxygenase (ABM) superfamily enzyme